MGRLNPLRVDWSGNLTGSWPVGLEEEALAMLVRERRGLGQGATVTVIRQTGEAVEVRGYRC